MSIIVRFSGSTVFYDMARFAKLTSYLRHRRPDDHINHSVYVFLLDKDELKYALEGEIETEQE
ncbi:MAG: hypothetical protein WAX69_09105 [Victivallales bacterium]